MQWEFRSTSTFCASCGLSELIRAKDQTDAIGIRLTIAPSPIVARVLAVTGLYGLLHTAPSPAQPHGT
jgi:anti-anti-sigma regulatory factor